MSSPQSTALSPPHWTKSHGCGPIWPVGRLSWWQTLRETPVRTTQPESGIRRAQPPLRCWHRGCCAEPGAEAGALWRGQGRELLAQEKEGKCMPVCPYAGDGGSQEARALIILTGQVWGAARALLYPAQRELSMMQGWTLTSFFVQYIYT